jgi:hypothetical protein
MTLNSVDVRRRAAFDKIGSDGRMCRDEGAKQVSEESGSKRRKYADPNSSSLSTPVRSSIHRCMTNMP